MAKKIQKAAEAAVGTAEHQDGVLTIDRAAAFLCCSRSKFYSMISSGQISVIRFGGNTRVELAELRRFVAAHRVEQPAQATPRASAPAGREWGTQRTGSTSKQQG